MHAAAKVEKGARVGIQRRERGDGALPCGKLARRSTQELAPARPAELSISSAGRARRSRAASSASTTINASCEVKLLVAGMASSTPASVARSSGRFARHGRAVNVGDRDRRMAAAGGFAQGRQRVGGLARLREHHHRTGIAGMAADMGGAAGVFAGVLHIDDQAGEVFEQDLRGQARVPAGAAGRDDQVRILAEERSDGAQADRRERWARGRRGRDNTRACGPWPRAARRSRAACGGERCAAGLGRHNANSCY